MNINTILQIFATKAYAASVDELIGQYDPTPDLDSLINSLLNRIPVYLGALAIIALLIAGVKYAFAYGDPAKEVQAKKSIGWTVVGIIAASSVMILIKLALWFVKPSVG